MRLCLRPGGCLWFSAATASLCAALACPCLTQQADAYTTDPHIAAFVELFANGRPAVVRCPDSAQEWRFDLGGTDDSDSESVYGRTFIHSPVVEFRWDLCPILAQLRYSDADDSTKALAVLTLLHESYHLRHWAWRLDEARVECQAIRHFRVGVRVLGGSQELADRLLPHALDWHAKITGTPGYHRVLPASELSPHLARC
jgi:hypothetical protein